MSTNVDYTAHPPPPLTPPGLSEKPVTPAATGAAVGSELTPAQAAMHKKVLEHFQSESYKIPGLKDCELREVEKFWLSNDCMLRFLRATKWNSANVAIERLEGTLKWRREFGVYDDSMADLVEPEAVTGKMIIFGYDTHRRPAVYMIPSRQNTEESPRQIQFTVWMLERALDLAGPDIESVVWMINFADKAKNPSFGTAKTVLNVLQTHYPERLSAALILNVPFLIQAFFKMISPFIDPITRHKMKFNPKPVQDGLFAADELFKDGGWGGAREFVWDHEKYWGPFVRMCAEIREGHMARWRKLGAHVGCNERDYKLGEVVDILPAPAEVEAKAETEAGDGDGDRVVAEDAAHETGDRVAQGQVPDESSAATDKVYGGGDSDGEGTLEPTAI